MFLEKNVDANNIWNISAETLSASEAGGVAMAANDGEREVDVRANTAGVRCVRDQGVARCAVQTCDLSSLDC